jgi:osmotically-inducible protein OsmY
VTGSQSGQTSATPESSNPSAVGSQSQSGSMSGQAGAATESQSGAQGSMSASGDTAQMQQQIQQALQQEPSLSNDSIQANVTSDKVELTGTVANGKDRKTAKRIAQSFAGNRQVVDHLTVQGKGSSNSSNPQPQK